jgi:rubredoxin-NAD+ reductase
VEESDEACVARYTDASGQLLGFALMGTATAQRQSLVSQIPAWLG